MADGTHSGWEIAQILAALVTDRDGVTAVANELTVQQLEQLQDQLMEGGGDPYFAIFSPEANLRMRIQRNVHAQQEQPTVTFTLVQSTADQQDLNDNQPAKLFGEKLDELHHLIYGTNIVLPAPFGQAEWPEQCPELPANEEFSTLSLRIRQLQYTFLTTRSGA